MQITSPFPPPPTAAAAGAAAPLFVGSAADPSAPVKAPSAGDAAVKDFMDFAKMTPAQKLRAAILSQMGLKEEDLAKMDPKERKKVEDKIAAIIKEKIEHGDENHKGVLVDVIA